jgi:hypothetical protein
VPGFLPSTVLTFTAERPPFNPQLSGCCWVKLLAKTSDLFTKMNRNIAVVAPASGKKTSGGNQVSGFLHPNF